MPPGRRKGDVKTGASDSAWLRAVVGEAGGDTARLLLVSQDKDVKAAFMEWKKACPLMRHRSELKATMSEFTVDQGRAEHLISLYLTASLNVPLPKISSVQLMPHVGTHGTLHRVGRVVVYRGWRFCQEP